MELTIPEESVYTLDPDRILNRLVKQIAGTIFCFCDYANLRVSAFKSIGAGSGVMRITEADARRRGPVWLFRIHRDDVTVRGGVERRSIFIRHLDAPIPSELRQEFEAFLRSLKIPGSTICSYRLAGSTKTPV